MKSDDPGHLVPGRNDPCPCSSGKKYKKCCLLTVADTAASRKLADAALVARERGDAAGALALLHKAAGLAPDDPGLHADLAKAHYDSGAFDAAIDASRVALRLDAHCIIAHQVQAGAAFMQGKFALARVSFCAALAVAPDNAVDHSNLGLVLAALGEHEAAVASLGRAIAIDPDQIDARSNMLFCLLHVESLPMQFIYEQHRQFGAFMAARHVARSAHQNSRAPARRLRLGFVSGDLRDHAVASFVETIWTLIDRTSFEIVGYANNETVDAVTQRLQRLATRWHMVARLADEELARLIEADGIDILIDLSGHTALNRLPVFCRKPAPLQASWIGYPATTGLATMDYYLADRHLAPAGAMDAFFVEKIVRLPAVCRFLPHPDAPAVNRLPALDSGSFMFASFNRNAKLNDKVIALWSRVLVAVPNARMLLAQVDDDAVRTTLTARFAAHGVAADRLVYQPKRTMQEYLALHHEVDLVLDAFPYSGGTTSGHAVWMGVPVLTLVGASMASRQTATILYPVGLAQFVTESEQDFVAQAVHWSRRLHELDAIRATLRATIAASPLTDALPIVRGFEQGMRTMWQRYCGGLPAESFEVI